MSSTYAVLIEIANILSRHQYLFKYEMTSHEIYAILNDETRQPRDWTYPRWCSFKRLYCRRKKKQYVNVSTLVIGKKTGAINEKYGICAVNKKELQIVVEFLDSFNVDDVDEKDLPDPKKLLLRIKRLLASMN